LSDTKERRQWAVLRQRRTALGKTGDGSVSGFFLKNQTQNRPLSCPLFTCRQKSDIVS